MSIDKEIGDFLQEERRVFEEREKEASPYLRNTKEKKGKEKAVVAKSKQIQLKEEWKEGKKDIRVACHNINGLKTRGWKLENLLGWAEGEKITILGITETNIAEKEEKFLLYSQDTQYKGY
jgi:hypothetical protein